MTPPPYTAFDDDPSQDVSLREDFRDVQTSPMQIGRFRSVPIGVKGSIRVPMRRGEQFISVGQPCPL